MNHHDEETILAKNNSLMNLKSNFDYAIMDIELEGEEDAPLSIYEHEVLIFDDFIFDHENDLKEEKLFQQFNKSYKSKVYVKNDDSSEESDAEGAYYTDPLSIDVHKFMSDFIQNKIEQNELLLEKIKK
jgi:hypothetical protein